MLWDFFLDNLFGRCVALLLFGLIGCCMIWKLEDKNAYIHYGILVEI